jgi:hypothetical protein
VRAQRLNGGARQGALAAAWIAAAAVLAYLAYVLIRYAGLDGYLDHMEPNVAIPAWLWLEGRPLYPAAGTEVDFVTTYGPLSYLIGAGVFSLAGGSIAASKLGPILAAALAVLVFAIALPRRADGALAAVGVAAFAGFMALFSPHAFWSRPDPYLVLLVTVALASVPRADAPSRGLAPAIVIAVAAGLAVDLKAHAFVFFLPVMARLWATTPTAANAFRLGAVIAAVSLATALVPFALPGVSLADYVANMTRFVVDVGGSAEVFQKSLRYGALMLAPAVALTILAARRRDAVFAREAFSVGVLALSFALLLYPASRPGAGAYQLMPLFPVAVDSLLRLGRAAGSRAPLVGAWFAAFALGLVVISVPVQKRLHRQFAAIEARAAAADVRAVIATLGEGETAEMGFGATLARYHDTYVRPLLVFAGQPFTFEAMTVMELKGVGQTVPARFAAHVGTCETDTWLIPKGEAPFAMPSYWGDGPVFDDAFRQGFLDTYRRERASRLFDVWTCEVGAGAAP